MTDSNALLLEIDHLRAIEADLRAQVAQLKKIVPVLLGGAEANNDPLVWVDLETTGLDPHTCRILEVGIVLTDARFNVLDVAHHLVGPVPEPEELDRFITDMHTVNGLLDAMRDAETEGNLYPISTADSAISILLDYWRDKYGWHPAFKPVLAGSSIAFDKSFIDIHMPNTKRLLHYRLADVSGLREFVSRWVDCGEIYNEKDKAHRVMADIDASINLARRLLDRLTGS